MKYCPFSRQEARRRAGPQDSAALLCNQTIQIRIALINRFNALGTAEIIRVA